MTPSDSQVSLSALRLAAIVAPVGFLAIVLYLLRGPAHEELHSMPGVLYVLAVLSLVVSGFSVLVFGLIDRLERRVLEQNRHLSVLNALAAKAVENLELDDLVGSALDEVLLATRADADIVDLIGDETGGVRTTCERRLPAGFAQRLRETTNNEVTLPVEREDFVELAQAEGFRSAVVVPVKAEGNVYGALGLVRRGEGGFSPGELDFLTSVAGQIGLAARNARLRERVLDRAVLEERERLGRELHDGLGQMIGYVNTQTLSMKKLLASGDQRGAERHLAQMEQTAERVCSDVREAILGLRTSGRGLLPSLRMYLADYGRISPTDVRLEVDPAAETLRLPPASEIQLMRIVQEALSNVRRHARARGATVRLACRDGDLLVEVADDGCGLGNITLVGRRRPSFGLQTMRERAEAAGGTFAIASTPGGGTTVSVRVPLEGAWEAAHARAAG